MPRATVFMGAPTLNVRMLAEPALTKQAASHMRLFIAGSAPLLIETFNAWRQRTGHTILERYGMSETIMLTSNPYAADARHGGQDERRGSTVGFALPGVGLRVVQDENQPLPVGEIGNIQVQGPQHVQGLLAHAREDGRGVHGRRLVQDRRRGQGAFLLFMPRWSVLFRWAGHHRRALGESPRGTLRRRGLKLPGAATQGCYLGAISKSAMRSPMMTVGAMVLPVETFGITEASAMESPSTPRTLRRPSTTAISSRPMRQVQLS